MAKNYVAIIAAAVGLSALIFIGMQYIAFDGSQLSAGKPKPTATLGKSGGYIECATAHKTCFDKAKTEYVKCQVKVDNDRLACMGVANLIENEGRQIDLQAGCELDSVDEDSTCLQNNTNDVHQCATEAKKCLKKYQEEEGIKPIFTPKDPNATRAPKTKAPKPGR